MLLRHPALLRHRMLLRLCVLLRLRTLLRHHTNTPTATFTNFCMATLAQCLSPLLGVDTFFLKKKKKSSCSFIPLYCLAAYLMADLISDNNLQSCNLHLLREDFDIFCFQVHPMLSHIICNLAIFPQSCNQQFTHSYYFFHFYLCTSGRFGENDASYQLINIISSSSLASSSTHSVSRPGG